MDNPPEISPIIKNLPFPQCAYILSVYWLEMLRVETVPKPSFREIFEYLCEPSIQKDKLWLWQCIARYVLLFLRYNKCIKTGNKCTI